jgi:hypothetical protein
MSAEADPEPSNVSGRETHRNPAGEAAAVIMRNMELKSLFQILD